MTKFKIAPVESYPQFKELLKHPGGKAAQNLIMASDKGMSRDEYEKYAKSIDSPKAIEAIEAVTGTEDDEWLKDCAELVYLLKKYGLLVTATPAEG